MIAKLERTQVMHNKTKTNTEPPQPMGSTTNNRSTTTEPRCLWSMSVLLHSTKSGFLRKDQTCVEKNARDIITII